MAVDSGEGLQEEQSHFHCVEALLDPSLANFISELVNIYQQQTRALSQTRSPYREMIQAR